MTAVPEPGAMPPPAEADPSPTRRSDGSGPGPADATPAAVGPPSPVGPTFVPPPPPPPLVAPPTVPPAGSPPAVPARPVPIPPIAPGPTPPGPIPPGSTPIPPIAAGPTPPGPIAPGSVPADPAVPAPAPPAPAPPTSPAPAVTGFTGVVAAVEALPHGPPGSTDTAIAVDDVSKWFGPVVAVSQVTFAVGHGVTALLGPNGAGKSTLFRMLCGLTAPSQGTIRVLGQDPKREASLARRIGLVPQQEGMFEPLNAFEFVRLAARLQGLPDPDGAARWALGVVELDPSDRRRLSTYSKGMRQRVKVAQAIVHDPEVLFLDEPLTGLDPRQRLHMIELFHRLGEQGRCVVVSSHVLDEVERLGSRVLVIVKGQLAAEGDFRAIRDLMDDRPHRIEVRTEGPRQLATGLFANGAALGVRITGPDRLVVDTADVHRFRSSVAEVAQAQGIRLIEVRPLDDDLESVFRYLVEH